MPLKVLSALDSAKTQIYHFKAIIVAGMGLFTDAYDLFCFPAIMKLLGRIYYENNPENTKYKIPTTVVTFMVGTALLGTAIGQVIFGRLGDRMGRRSVYGTALMLMVISSLGCGFSICRTRNCVLFSLGLFRFFLGLGIGGDYPLSATIMSEFANKRTRGSFIAGVFSMQGFGILVSSAVTMGVCKIFWRASMNLTEHHTPQDADIAWRLILMFGAIPAALTYYWRMMMPETARYTALVENNVVQAAKDMEKVLDVPMTQIAEDEALPPQDRPTYRLLSNQFFRRHGRDLFSCSLNWFLLDIAFYSTNLFQSQIYSQFLKLNDDTVYQEVVKVARFQAILAICSTIPGYYFTLYFIDRIGRRRIQIMGFLLMGIVYFALGIPYHYWRKNTNVAFLFLYALTLFFANFGPNTTTFIMPAELFPARFRSTCHGIAGATGKMGALLGAIGVLYASEQQDENNYPKAKPMQIALLSLGVVCLTGMGVTYVFTPETMGRSLEENENENDNEDEDHNQLRRFRTSMPRLALSPN
ncbi:probable inorganic phosphate transporter 1-8 [Mercurialis annua]|uniref:probable inorganic phosphate transporter 1-8 n=1 Tax=Mercurialis annua TaxID=3986 RepID=UPI00215EA351|nr:probable inorganic phosphate transporter 1-8 [Mercurialis annua]